MIESIKNYETRNVNLCTNLTILLSNYHSNHMKRKRNFCQISCRIILSIFILFIFVFDL